MLKNIQKKFWNSPTLMTWLSYSTKALSLFIVLPLILKNFTTPEISLWYLFTSIILLLGLADFGFKSTFSRIISFAFGGAKDVGIYTGKRTEVPKSPNWPLIERIYSNMSRIYLFLTVILLLLFITLGSWSLIRPISLVDDPEQAWFAWIIIIITSLVKFYGTIYLNYLEGLNKIALVRRIESFMSLGMIVTSILVLLFGGNLLQLIIAVQIWVVLNVVRNWYLARIVENGKHKYFKKLPYDKVFFLKIWKPAWRSGLSGLMSNGLTLLSGILYAQVGAVEVVAGYLLSLRIVTQIKEISMAPFYSKIPLMARLRVEGNQLQLKDVAQKGMFIGHTVFVLGAISVSIFSEPLIALIDSNVTFVSDQFWLLLCFAFFVHRYGAMHIQLYLTTNHVISHIADSVSGILFIIFAFVFVDSLGLYAFPLGMLLGYLGFYAWYAAYFSMKSLSTNFFDFEKKAILLPFFSFLFFVFLDYLVSHFP